MKCEISIVITPRDKLSAHDNVMRGFASINHDNEDLSSIPFDLSINNILLETSSIFKTLEGDNNSDEEMARASKNLSGLLTHESENFYSETKNLYLQEVQGGDLLGNQCIEDSLEDENLLIELLDISQSWKDCR
ncbi:hypothetical protein [Richelia intracellularis]|nr:hypothetical protein [Richelia intracellularis]